MPGSLQSSVSPLIAFAADTLSRLLPALRRHLAASEGRVKVVSWLLKQGADVNFLDRFKRTPLEVPHPSARAFCGNPSPDAFRLV